MKYLQANDPANRAQFDALADNHLDITGAAYVGVSYSAKDKVLWVNVNSVCVLRICQIEKIHGVPGQSEVPT